MATKVEYPKEATEPTVAVSLDELEAMIRRVVREEVDEAMAQYALPLSPTVIEPGSSLYEGMVDIAERAKRGELEFYSHEEVWADE
jgi:hypothetical protein